MQRTIPIVEGGQLYQSEREGDPIVVGTPAWYDWLERHTAFLFVDLVGGCTVQKSGSDSSELDWQASRMRRGKLYKVSLGPSHTLTLERLQAAARTLAGEQAPAEPTEVSPAEPTTSQLPAPATAVQVGPSSSLMRSKLYWPRLSSDVLSRARLIERLNAGLGGPLTLLCAPTGFGKTTLLADWLQTLPRQAAWYRLDETDNEVVRFVDGLTAALHTVWPDACPAISSLLKAARFPTAESVASMLINDLADVPEDIILVLDDYHLIHTSEVHTLLDLLIPHLPPQLHLVLATRSDPPLPLSRWRAQGRLNELRGADLRFTREETQAFLARVLGEDLAQETALELEERTQGSIAVLRLAALSLRSAADRVAFLQRLRHSPDRNISSYLLEEILAQQAPFVQELLVRTSILEQFCAQVCAAILGSEASTAQVEASLDGLERSNLLLVPLDEHQGWYRFHYPFKPLLEQRLQAHSSTKEIAVLHRRASAWYAEQGLIAEAIRHALAAGDTAGAAQLRSGGKHNFSGPSSISS